MPAAGRFLTRSWQRQHATEKPSFANWKRRSRQSFSSLRCRRADRRPPTNGRPGIRDPRRVGESPSFDPWRMATGRRQDGSVPRSNRVCPRWYGPTGRRILRRTAMRCGGGREAAPVGRLAGQARAMRSTTWRAEPYRHQGRGRKRTVLSGHAALMRCGGFSRTTRNPAPASFLRPRLPCTDRLSAETRKKLAPSTRDVLTRLLAGAGPAKAAGHPDGPGRLAINRRRDVEEMLVRWIDRALSRGKQADDALSADPATAGRGSLATTSTRPTPSTSTSSRAAIRAMRPNIRPGKARNAYKRF